MYGSISGVKMIFRLLTGSWRFNSSDSLLYHISFAYYTHTQSQQFRKHTLDHFHQFSLYKEATSQRDRAWRLLGTFSLLS